MKAALVLASIGIFLMIFAGDFVSGSDEKRSCWLGQSGPQGHMTKVQCDGSCVKRQDGDHMRYGCWFQECTKGCRMLYSMRVCFCNEPLCNTGSMPANSLQLSPFQYDMNLDWPQFKDVGSDNSKSRLNEELSYYKFENSG